MEVNQTSELARKLNTTDEELANRTPEEIHALIERFGGPDMMGFVGHGEGVQ